MVGKQKHTDFITRILITIIIIIYLMTVANIRVNCFYLSNLISSGTH